MKSAQIRSYGHSDQIRIDEINRPAEKPDELLVRIKAAGVNPVDWKIREGFLSKVAPKKFPFTLGQDFSGEVTEVGNRVEGWKAGDKVFGFADGSYAEYCAVSPGMIARKPKSIDFETAAGLPTPALTAYQIVMKTIQAAQGQTILIHGAAGGVGSLATQLCILRGARVIATAAARDSSYLQELGVKQIIDYKTQRFEDHVKEVDAVIDLVGGDTLSRSLPIIKKGGMLVTTVGPLNEADAAQRGIRGVQFVMTKNGSDLAEIARLVDDGKLKTRVSRVVPLTQAKEAQDLNQSGHSHGKVILKVA